jgi:hypothetical protein
MRIDFEGAGTFGGTSDDVSARTLSVSWKRGRDYASQLTGRSQSGKLSATLNNESGDYASFNTSSPISGSLLPGRLVELTGTLNGTSHDLWRGYLQRIVPSPAVLGLNTAKLEAIGPMGYLNQRKVNMAMVSDMLTGSAIGTVMDGAGWGTGRTLDDGQTILARFWVDDTETIRALRHVEETEAGFLSESKDGKIVYEDRHHRLKSPHTSSQASFSDAGTLGYSGVQQEDPLPQVFNILEARVQRFTIGTSQTLWTLADTGTASPLVGRNSGTLTLWARYPNPDSSTDAFGVDSWTDLVADTDYTANSRSDGGGTDLTDDVSIATTKLGNALKMIITNNSGSADAYITLLQARGTPVTRDDPVSVSAEDTTSQAAYGERSWPNPAQFLPDIKEAEDWGLMHISIYKDPQPIVAISVPANKDDTHLEQVLSRDISDRVTIVGTGEAGLGLNEDFFIEAESHQVDAQRTHRCTWECSRAAGFSDFWVLGTSPLGTSTRLAY